MDRDSAPTAPREGAQSVHRTLALLQCFADSPQDLTGSDLARRTGLALSTAHRLLKVLTNAGILEQDPATARYRLGPSLAELGRLAYHRRGLHRAEPELAELAAHTGATADLATRVGGHAVILAGGSLDRDGARGLRRPLHSTALGKVLLAWGDNADLTALPLEQLTRRTITDPQHLREELERVRTAGFALNEGESTTGVRTIAVPVLDHTDQARFAVALRSSPEAMASARLAWFVEQAAACATALEVLLLPPGQRRTGPRPPIALP
ncbi:IclR family transcriptional regulator [Catenulispora sp. NF23]|uniref:IclR family transcriptional regulator n=1 Tax=Catenulispora pinistramenti TaxID=2705254 RepID=A0ABS5L1U9_9ACTN|nr:IclR family transcriptional regulator [Catenulispora pinistramenti]MBS2535773.1 IclR family transcriptional regulator [Catenulispora pinistramenti]MBS2552120.1 IclR family transcriptional regulator [Catenulispora pinistramenti]